MGPEKFVIIIGGLLMLITAVLAKISNKIVGKCLWIFFIILVIASVIGGISLVDQKEKEKLQREKEETQNKEERKKMASIITYFYNEKPIPVGFSGIATITVKPMVIHANGQVDLKDRANNLFLGINKFLIARENKKPAMPREATFEADIDKIISYVQDTLNQYSSYLTPQVIAIRDEFARKGLIDNELDKYYQHPRNPTEIHIVAERIQSLQGRLP